jgi:hypothetical protein
MSKPEYTVREIGANTWTVAAAMLRGGRLTAREQRRLERIRDKAVTRGNTPLSER